MSGKKWDEHEIALLVSMYPECHTQDVAAWLGRTLRQVYMAALLRKVRKSAEYLASDCAARIQRGKTDSKMMGARFMPGHQTWNKGVKGSTGKHPNCQAHYFGKGRMPQTWVPVGSVRINPDGILQRKVSDTGVKTADWRAVHALAWESVHGPIPAGMLAVFKPGMRTTEESAITADRVECVTRAENMRRNSVHANYPPEIARLHQLRGALNRQINKRTNQVNA